MHTGLAGTQHLIQKLELDLYRCTGIGDGGAGAVADNLPPTLRALHLNFYKTGLGEAAVLRLAAGIPRGETLSVLSLDLAFSPGITSASVRALVTGLPSGLEKLRLNFYRCRELTDAGVCAIAAAFPAGLQELVLDLGSGGGFGRSSALLLLKALRGLPNLQSLTLKIERSALQPNRRSLSETLLGLCDLEGSILRLTEEERRRR